MKRTISAISAAFLMTASTIWGQSLTSLNGLVTDPTGAAIPAAKITATEVNTGVTRETESDGVGRYQFQALNPGLYKLVGKKDGFSDISIQNLRLLVNTPATVNIAFEKVGAVAQTVEVSASGVQLNTVDASLGNSFGTKPILQLPFEGRNVAKILSLQAGVSWVGDTDSVNGGVSTAVDRGGVVNGGKSDQSNITLDGIDNNNQQDRTAFSGILRVTLDSVQEFRVTTTNATADSSRGSGAQVSMVTKSGTNTLHGSAYHYLRNKALNANTFFNNQIGLATPKLNRNIFGASLGGPIKKNKLFLFGNYEGRRDSREDSVLRTVPTDAIRNGIASYVSQAGTVVQVNSAELATRLNYAPGANQAALDMLKSYPTANDFTAGDGLNSAGFRFNAPKQDKFDTYVAKLDWVVSDKHNAFIRGQLQDDIVRGTPQFPGLAPNFQDLTNSKGLAFGLNSVWTNSLVSSTRYGFTRQSFESAGIGQYALVRFGRLFSDRVGLDRSVRVITPVNNLTHDFTLTKGAHTLQFGGSFRRYTIDRLNYGNSYFAAASNSSWMTSSGQILSAPWVGTAADPASTRIAAGSRTQFNDAVATIFGLVTQVTSNYNYLPSGNGLTALAPGAPAPRKFRGEESELFFQDSWRLTRGLTFTAGVRYQYWPAVYEAQGAQTSPNIPLSQWFDRRVANANAGLAGQTGLDPISYNLASSSGGRPLYDNLKNWSPRAALAYSPQGDSGLAKVLFGGAGKSVLRLGWGLYYDSFGPGLLRGYDASALGLATSLNNSSGRLSLADAPRFTGLFNVPQSLVTAAPAAAFPVLQPNNFAITNSVDDTIRAPYVMRYNVSLQREIKDGWTMNVAYVASAGRRTMTSEDLATPLNIRDPQSGQTWYQAANALLGQMPLDARRQLGDFNPAGIRPVAYFENMFPGLAGNGQTATQVMSEVFAAYFPDMTAVLESVDRFSDPAPSRLGAFAYYSRQYSFLRAIRSVGMSSYNSMQVSMRKTFRNADQIDFNWTWAHSIDMGSVSENNQNTNDGLRGIIISPYNRRLMRASSDFDQRHNINANYIYNLPVGQGARFLSNLNPVANHILGGWQVAGLFRWTTGLPGSVGHNRTWPTNYNITGWATTVGSFADGTNKNAQSPVANANAAAEARNSGPNIFQNPRAAQSAFGFTLPGEIGDRNHVRGDGIFNIDMSLAKNFKMPLENHTLQFRWEVFNLTNSTRFDPLNANIGLSSLSNFGKYIGTLQPSRVMQVSLRYDF
ncbi:MAG: TonB-dependent receptor [Bryobacterales bacterium]|nr:TonB-dependent receptor [Bryobacterales bacterium]